MQKAWILVLLCFFFAEGFAKEDKQRRQRRESMCRSPISYQSKKHVKTGWNCNSICDKDSRCLMSKYSKRAQTCWLFDSRPGPKCSTKIDFGVKDVNECKVNRKLCGKDAECFNTHGSFDCICYKSGFVWRKGVDLCSDYNECQTAICGEYADCQNTIGSYKCSCYPGFKKLEENDCKDYDECGQENICGEYADCQNTIGSYKCSCHPGFKKLEENSCVDVDECAAETRHCSKKSKCINTVGSYTCRCNNGEKFCEDEKLQTEAPTTEAITTTSKPPTTIAATDIPENALREPWISHPKLCISVKHYEVIREITTERECRWHCEQQKKCVLIQYDTDSGECWLCHDREMKPKTGCKKPLDYYVKGRNECEGKRGKCHRNAVCKTSKGHRVCQCVYGFKGDGWNCKDINECSYYEDLCGANAKCVNKIGRYSCKCKRGFKREDGRCKKKESSILSKPKYDYISQWKREHESNAATSVYAITASTAISIVLLHQFFWL